MTLKAIIDKCSMVSVHEVRHVTDHYGELVVYNAKMDKWNQIFVDLLGPPKKPLGVEPSDHDLELTQEYGGIWSNQTLFEKELDDFTLIAMYWPWQDGVHTTVKLAHVSK